ncbi:TPA: hypothetical protein DF272_05175 [Candidatus Falkowbacteria bacterium]|nr:hypothetical protein [Candidatus Falkowbacteria bacterium]
MSFDIPNNQTPLKSEQPPTNEKEKFYAEETVNGHLIICRYVNSKVTKLYEIYLPQIELSSAEAETNDVPDQVIAISDDEEEARFVFRQAKKWAEEEGDLYRLYKRIDKLTCLL